MSGADIATQGLLTAAAEALDLPYPSTPRARVAYLELGRDRAAVVRCALHHALTSGDMAAATDMIDSVALTHPVTYPAEQRWSPAGMEAQVPR
ncbi:hypothetical protein ACFWTE_05455 [Nocardiopsis sp. NPDC058631]|uniref:hypothetical protein n=1 Tax=Nocardiopsis sp. NPDC058631 TaxID=3346566 RepID=UPI0036491D0F